MSRIVRYTHRDAKIPIFASRCVYFIFTLFFSLMPSLYAERPLLLADDHGWMDRIVEEEFAFYNRTGITKKQLEVTWKACRSNPSFQRYKVIASHVYGPPGSIRNLLEMLVKTYHVPNVDFIYYHHDVLRDSFFKNLGLARNAPIFVSAKNRSLNRAILFVDWYYDIQDDHAGWNALVQVFDAHQNRWPWSEKIEKLFWRGGPTDGFYTLQNWTQFPRGQLVFLSQFERPDLIDASFTGIHPWQTNDYEEFKKQIGVTEFVSQLDHTQFKYQLLIDGVTATYPGTQWRLLSGCLMMKQESDEIMWFSRELIPWEHYVPLESNLSDVVEKILWAQDHDAESRKIALHAQEFARTHLMPEHILLYCYKTLMQYASLQRFQPEVE